MKTRFFQRILFFSLALSTLSGLAACGKEEPKTLPETQTQEITETVQNAENGEIMDRISVFTARVNEGELTKPGESRILDIKTQEELSGYKALFPELTEEEASAMLSDKGGRILLIEIRQNFDGHSYYCNSVSRDGGFIDLYVNESESEEATKHNFFLFYFPSELYNREDIRLMFIQ